MLTWTAIKTFFGGIVGKIVAGIALVAAALIGKALYDRGKRKEGENELKAAQQKKLADERQKRDENEDDLRTMPGDRLDDELRERPRDS